MPKVLALEMFSLIIHMSDCNSYRRIKLPCHLDPSSHLGREPRLLEILEDSSTDLSSIQSVMTIVSDRKNTDFPFFRDAKKPDYLSTAATGQETPRCTHCMDVITDPKQHVHLLFFSGVFKVEDGAMHFLVYKGEPSDEVCVFKYVCPESWMEN